MAKDFSVNSPFFNILLKNIKRQLGGKVTFLSVVTSRNEKWIEWKTNGNRFRTQRTVPELVNYEYFEVLKKNIENTIEDGRDRNRTEV